MAISIQLSHCVHLYLVHNNIVRILKIIDRILIDDGNADKSTSNYLY